MRNDILERENEIRQWISENQSKAFISKQLKCKQETLNSYLAKMGIEYSGNQSHKGQQIQRTYKTAIEYIESGSIVKSYLLKQKLVRDGLKEDKCELCGVSEWLNVKLPLELHHKDGDHFNNDLDNLQILCPNCHSIQEGNAGANTGRYTQERQIQFPKETKVCLDCGKKISPNAVRCKNCASIEKQKDICQRPDREELKSLIRSMPFVQIGKKYGVSDNAIRKWCDFYNLPRKSTEIKKYTEQEWELI